ncbi:MAG: D-alanine--D-alanine ligase [Caldisericia bacterium]|nr:D-alanine--D-alanine ligase [Caldisericia bacterium]
MNILIFFGGISPEHEISVISSQTVVKNIDLQKHTPILVGISPTGQWRLFSLEDFFKIHRVEDLDDTPPISLQFSKHPLLHIEGETLPIHCAFPILHGKAGEDGCIQGLLESFHIPYVGCDVESSSLCMNKILTKIVLAQANIPITPYQTLTRHQFQEANFSPQEYIDTFDLPVFIKEPHGGSSIGVSKVSRPDQFYSILKDLFQHENTALIEKTIIGREIECAVLTSIQNDSIHWMASLPGEIIPKREFYDYTAKYLEDTTQLDVPAHLPKELVHEIQSLSIKAAKTVGCFGLARIDFFLTKDNHIVVNEINTIPGFTSISMYPSLWRASGMDTPQLIENLIQSAFYRKESTL